MVVDPQVVFVASLMKAAAPALVASFQCDVSLQSEDDGTQNMRASLRELKVLARPFIPDQQEDSVTTVSARAREHVPVLVTVTSLLSLPPHPPTGVETLLCHHGDQDPPPAAVERLRDDGGNHCQGAFGKVREPSMLDRMKSWRLGDVRSRLKPNGRKCELTADFFFLSFVLSRRSLRSSSTR